MRYTGDLRCPATWHRSSRAALSSQRVQVWSADLQVPGLHPNARLARLREALPPSNAIAGSICAANLWWLRRLIYPASAAFVAAAARGWCSADTILRIMTCLMPSTRKPARSVGLNAACTSGLASWRLVIWGCVTL